MIIDLLCVMFINFFMIGCGRMGPLRTTSSSKSRNNLDIKKVNQLHLGMSKQTVMNLIGSPNIIDPFYPSQWDYINYSTIDGASTNKIKYHLRLIFSGNLLSEIDKSGL